MPGYLKEGVTLEVLRYNGAPVSLQLPQYVDLAVVTAEWAYEATPPPEEQRSKRHWKPVSQCEFRSLSKREKWLGSTLKQAKSRAARSPRAKHF